MYFEYIVHAGAKPIIARRLSAIMLCGAWTERALARRLEQCLGYATLPEQRNLIAEVLVDIRTPYPPSPSRLTRLILESTSFEDAAWHRLINPNVMALALRAAPFKPIDNFETPYIPKLNTIGDLASWLEISITELNWLADVRRSQFRATKPPLHHYRYSFASKASGPPRLIEAPKQKLKAVQRRILHGILDYAPVHSSAHGFVAGRSCLTSAQIHAGEEIVATLDLEDFFPSVSVGRVHAIFRMLGFPWTVARALTSLCSTSTPRMVFERLNQDQRHSPRAQDRFATPHLAQGAPTSPALANLAAWRLDARLHGLARAYEANYSRYADDLSFSGGAHLSQRIDSFLDVAATIIEDEGHRLNVRKTKVMRRSTRQKVTGIVVNEQVNIGRNAYDRLKAILYNCVRYGPGSQNREGRTDFRAHLEGRIGWVENLNPLKGRRLRLLFAKIDWA